VAWNVEYTDEFEAWWTEKLAPDEQDEIAAVVGLLERKGPQLPFPYSSAIKQSKYAHLRELRIQHGGKPFRVLYAFDPRRTAILLIGGEKTGQQRWYQKQIRVADRLYEEHLEQLQREGLI
jgi:hypothetical protein